MKRSVRPEFSPDQPPPRRKRALSEAERELWESVVKQTRPLRKKPRAAKAPPPIDETPVPTRSAPAPKSPPAAKSAKTTPPAQPAPAPPSDAELELWEAVAKQTRPLRKKPRAAKAPAAPPIDEKPAPTRSAPAPKSPPAEKSATTTSLAQPAPAPPLAPLGRRERSQLSRGRKDIDARLDLHGMTQERAHHTLLSFLQRANRDGLRFVLVITGKGRVTGPESERGVLRRQVPHWLSLPEFRSLVVGFETAHIGHGGEGALYVRVRRGTRMGSS